MVGLAAAGEAAARSGRRPGSTRRRGSRTRRSRRRRASGAWTGTGTRRARRRARPRSRPTWSGVPLRAVRWRPRRVSMAFEPPAAGRQQRIERAVLHAADPDAGAVGEVVGELERVRDRGDGEQLRLGERERPVEAAQRVGEDRPERSVPRPASLGGGLRRHLAREQADRDGRDRERRLRALVRQRRPRRRRPRRDVERAGLAGVALGQRGGGAAVVDAPGEPGSGVRAVRVRDRCSRARSGRTARATRSRRPRLRAASRRTAGACAPRAPRRARTARARAGSRAPGAGRGRAASARPRSGR